MKIHVRYSPPGGPSQEGHIIGCSPVECGSLVMLLPDGSTTIVDGDFITEIFE